MPRLACRRPAHLRTTPASLSLSLSHRNAQSTALTSAPYKSPPPPSPLPGRRPESACWNAAAIHAGPAAKKVPHLPYTVGPTVPPPSCLTGTPPILCSDEPPLPKLTAMVPVMLLRCQVKVVSPKFITPFAFSLNSSVFGPCLS